MLVPTPPKSNAERQRRFQAAHPGYDRRRKARRRGMLKRAVAQIRQAEEAMAAEAKPAEPLALPAPLAVPAIKAPIPIHRDWRPLPVLTSARLALLALPAPVVDPAIAELEALRAALASSRARAGAAQPVRPVPVAA